MDALDVIIRSRDPVLLSARTFPQIRCSEFTPARTHLVRTRGNSYFRLFCERP
jgi:hypothetical protein